MLKLAPATAQFQHFAWKKLFEADSDRQRDRFAVVEAYERNAEQRRDYRNGYYERGFVTVLISK